MTESFTPSKRYLERYADILINFALGSGKGIKKGDVVAFVVPEIARPLYIELSRAILKAEGLPLGIYLPSAESTFDPLRELFTEGNEQQSSFFPEKYYEGLIGGADHYLRILADTNKESLMGIDLQRIFRRVQTHRKHSELFLEKEGKGKLTWSLALYGTEAYAKEANLSLEEYWQQIINACFLDKRDPVSEWRKTSTQIDKTVTWLNSLSLEKIHLFGEDCDLHIKIGKDRKWDGGGGANIPSFEIYTSPDWRGTEGWIRFNQPLYQHGSLIEGIGLEFKKGKVVKYSATKNESILKALIETKNADKIGEFSLTDGRVSRITKFMAETLYDENRGGEQGNTHIALGMAYKSCFRGKKVPQTKAEWENRGFNDSAIHSDIVSTAQRTAIATLSNGKEITIYKSGKFTYLT